MAVLSSNVKYGLSNSARDPNHNKELIFVKLTDSALKAIEEYARNKNQLNQRATIQFLGNEGILSFPTTSNEGSSSIQFKFGMSSTADMEGPAGSLQCIQQPPRRHGGDTMDVLGAMSRKMRVQANDDLYETTRHRMVVAEETQKNKCAREIKPSLLGGGNNKKVNSVKSSLGTVSRVTPTIVRRDQTSTSSLNTSSNTSSSTTMPFSNNSNNLGNNARSTLSPMLHNQSGASVAANQSSSSVSPLRLSTNSSSSLSRNSSSVANSNSSRTNNNNNRGNKSSSQLIASLGPTTTASTNGSSAFPHSAVANKPITDVMKRPIRERLVHLLAVRPFKKPELFDRLNREGVREREKNCITNVLKQISMMQRDNTYHLLRHIWNDVNDDWPYYTEQEKQMLKRRKPQNLTPPGSSDGGSSGSGQSPASTNPGSPLTPIGGNGGLMSKSHSSYPSPTQGLKRPGYYDNADGTSTKRQRISHYRKPTTPDAHVTASVTETTTVTTMKPTTPDHDYRTNRNRYDSDNDDDDAIVFGSARKDAETSRSAVPERVVGKHKLPRETSGGGGGGEGGPQAKKSTAMFMSENSQLGRWTEERQDDAKHSDNQTVLKDSKQAIDALESVLDGEHLVTELLNRMCDWYATIDTRHDHIDPEYLQKYGVIRTAEQRREYKNKFNDEYNEYKMLHEIVEGISTRFRQFRHCLDDVYDNEVCRERIRQQVLIEYNHLKNNTAFTRARSRFDYLHDKLAYIKKLVNEYDQKCAMENASGNTGNSCAMTMAASQFDDARTNMFVNVNIN